MRRVRLVLLAAVMAGIVCTTSAAAAKPVPDCHGFAFTDRAGDQQTPNGTRAPENLDLLGGFFTYAGGKTYANLIVKDLRTAPPPGANGNIWMMHYTIGGTDQDVYADTDSSGNVSYYYSTGPNMIDTTTGTLYPGADGVVQIAIPPAQGAVKGATLEAPWGEADEDQQAHVGGVLFAGQTPQADRAPDNGTGIDYKVGAPCPVAIRVLTHNVSQHIVDSDHAVRVMLRASALVRRVKVKLTHAAKTVASGGLHQLQGQATVSLPIRHGIARGHYELLVTATDAATGAAVQATASLTVTP